MGTYEKYYTCEWNPSGGTGDSPTYYLVGEEFASTATNSGLNWKCYPPKTTWDSHAYGDWPELTPKFIWEEAERIYEDLKMSDIVKEEVKKFMTKKLKNALRKETDGLTEDIEKLKKEKTEIKQTISALRAQMKKDKEDMEQMLKKYADCILRYKLMDL